MKKLVLQLFLFFTLCSCSEQVKIDNNSKYLLSQTQPVIDNFFENIQKIKYQFAIDELLNKNENIDSKDSLTISLKKKFIGINESSGKFISKKLLKSKQIDDDIGVYTYLVKYEKKFYRFVFVFYNSGNNVKIYRFSFDDVVDIELEEALKLYVN
jgi:hypothetical protein